MNTTAPLQKVDGDGKHISDSFPTAPVLVINGDEIDDSHNSTVGHMSVMLGSIDGAKAEAAYVCTLIGSFI